MKPRTTYQAVLGRLIASKRRQKRMDQDELARHVGVTRSTWSRLEAGLSVLNVAQLAMVASRLGVSVGELTTEADDMVRSLLREDFEVLPQRGSFPDGGGGPEGHALGATVVGGAFLGGSALGAIVAPALKTAQKGQGIMAYTYRTDEGLDFLAGVPSEDLEGLVALLVDARNQNLTETESYRRHFPEHKMYWREIATEIQTFGGNTFSNIYRGKGTFYRDILHDVCDRLKVNYNEGSSISAIEMNLLQKALADTFEQLDSEGKAEILGNLGVKNARKMNSGAALAAAQMALRAGGFAAYKWALIIANALAKQLLGKGLSFAANAALTRSLSMVIGPIGLALATAWTAYDLAGPAYRVTVPAVLHVTLLRLKQRDDVSAALRQ